MDKLTEYQHSFRTQYSRSAPNVTSWFDIMTSLPWRSTGSDVVTLKNCFNWWKEVEERCEVNVKSVLLKY